VSRRVGVGALLVVVLLALSGAVLLTAVTANARSGAVSADAVLPCAQARHPAQNVRCAVDDEVTGALTRRAATDAQLAASTAAIAHGLADRQRVDTCALLTELRHSAATDRLRADLSCDTAAAEPPGLTPTLIPAPSTGGTPSSPSSSAAPSAQPSGSSPLSPPRASTPLSPSSTRSPTSNPQPSPTSTRTSASTTSASPASPAPTTSPSPIRPVIPGMCALGVCLP